MQRMVEPSFPCRFHGMVGQELDGKEYLEAAMHSFIMLLGTDHFTSIIRSAEKMNPMKLRLKLSQKIKGS